MLKLLFAVGQNMVWGIAITFSDEEKITNASVTVKWYITDNCRPCSPWPVYRHLSGNMIVSLPEDVFQDLKSLQYL
jgi:hypothetical protein